MPYKEWAVGEEVLAADFNPAIARQVIPVFDNATARTAAMVTPGLGQLSYLKSAPGRVDYWGGTGWIPLQGTGMRAGNIVLTTNSLGRASVSWTTPLWPGGAGPEGFVAAITNGDTAQGLLHFGVTSISSTGLTFTCASSAGVTANKTVRVHYIVSPDTPTA